MATMRRSGGRLRLELVDNEAALLRDLLGDVAALLADDGSVGPPVDPVLARLLPDAHHDDPRIAAAQRELTEESLRQDKLADIAVVLAAMAAQPGADGSGVDIEEFDPWLRALNDVRLMLGVELDISEDVEPPRVARNPREFRLAVYFWLTHLQECLVEAALSDGDGQTSPGSGSTTTP